MSGGLADPRMLDVVADAGAAYVAMHWRGAQRPDARLRARTTAPAAWSPRSATSSARRVDAMLAAGIAPDRIVLDPGLGFAKRAEHNWELLPGSTG